MLIESLIVQALCDVANVRTCLNYCTLPLTILNSPRARSTWFNKVTPSPLYNKFTRILGITKQGAFVPLLAGRAASHMYSPLISYASKIPSGVHYTMP